MTIPPTSKCGNALYESFGDSLAETLNTRNGDFPLIPPENGVYSNKSILRYRSPVSGSITTISLPTFSGRIATLSAA